MNITRRAIVVLGLWAAAFPAMGASAREGFCARAAALSPDAPMAYFELAEEVAYELQTAQGRRLAMELLVIADALDRASDAPVPLGRSVCLALADLSTDSAERTWLIAMARAQMPAGEDRGGVAVVMGASTDADRATRARAVRVELAMALARFRATDTRPLRQMLDSGDAARALTEAGIPQADAAELIRLVNGRIAELRRIRSTDSDGRVVRSLVDGVTTYALDERTGGHPGPMLAEHELLLVVGAEARLLDAEPDAWAADLEVTRGQPVRDINPASLAAYFGVETDRVWFVPSPQAPDDPAAGTWSASPPPGRGSNQKMPDERIGDQPDQHDGQVDDGRDEEMHR